MSDVRAKVSTLETLNNAMENSLEVGQGSLTAPMIDRDLTNLCEQFNDVAHDLTSAPSRLCVEPGKMNKFKSLGKALESTPGKNHVREVERGLDRYRSQVTMYTVFLLQ